MLALNDIKELITNISAGLNTLVIEEIPIKLEPSYETISNITNDFEQYQELAILCSDQAITHPDWSLLAGRVLISYVRSIVPPTFIEATKRMKGILNDKYYTFVMENQEELEKLIVPERDFNFNIIASATLMKTYFATLRTENGRMFHETPQYMYMRIAIYHWYPNFYRIKEMYDDLSLQNLSMATPNMCNSGMKRSQLGSCFMMTVGDSMQAISDSWKNAAIISQNMGGLGIDFGNLRHSEIGNGGETRGIVPWLRVTEVILTAVDQGNRRPGSGTIFLPDWHIDIFDFINCKNPEKKEDMRALKLFYALWLSDEFMRRVKNDEDWTLFCPNKFKGLNDCWGIEFEMLYRSYEEKVRSGKYRGFEIIKARKLWNKALKAQFRFGMPFMLFKDAFNRKTNQQNIGIIRQSNLCTEMAEVTDTKNIASCILGSICLPNCIENGEFNFAKLGVLCRRMVRHLNSVIDRNYYPPEIPEIEHNNMDTRPLGIGVQGLADTFAILDLAWTDPRARKLNLDIFETMYYNAMLESMKLSQEFGPYKFFEGSPAHKGYLQFDLWKKEKLEKEFERTVKTNPNLDTKKHVRETMELLSHRENSMYSNEEWNALRRNIQIFGLRNSLLMALMPTASSAHIAGNNETIEPFTQLVYARTILSGQFVMVNKHLVRDLENINLWNTESLRNIMQYKGSIQNLPVPDDERADRVLFLKEKYKTVYELPQKLLIDMNIDRSQYICQSISFNLWLSSPDTTKLHKALFHQWESGAKTAMYYLRQLALSDPLDFSTDSISVPQKKKKTIVCNDEVCISCQA